VKSYHPKLAMQKSSTEQRADQKHEGNNWKVYPPSLLHKQKKNSNEEKETTRNEVKKVTWGRLAANSRKRSTKKWKACNINLTK
jgi:hypothetical protein